MYLTLVIFILSDFKNKLQIFLTTHRNTSEKNTQTFFNGCMEANAIWMTFRFLKCAVVAGQAGRIDWHSKKDPDHGKSHQK